VEAKLKQQLNEDLKKAMKDGDKIKRSAIRLLLSAVHNAEIAKQAELADGDILGIIAKEIRQRKESIEAFKKGNRQELVDQEEAELAALQAYMPQQASRDDIIAEARKIIAEVGATGPGDKGKVMPQIIAKFKGRADGREINEVVTELLS
jgi:uncharacterized protein YqeY